jgi:uncharacterized protein (DUF934 family)
MDYTEEQDLPRVSLREVTDLCLRFADEQEAILTLYKLETTKTPTYDDEGNQTGVSLEFSEEWVPLYRNIDTIGVIYKPTGSTIVLEDGTESPEMTAAEGWHVNVRVMPDEDIEELEPYKVNPEPLTPVRVWV